MNENHFVFWNGFIVGMLSTLAMEMFFLVLLIVNS